MLIHGVRRGSPLLVPVPRENPLCLLSVRRGIASARVSLPRVPCARFSSPWIPCAPVLGLGFRFDFLFGAVRLVVYGAFDVFCLLMGLVFVLSVFLCVSCVAPPPADELK